jgi:hypothetical protein
MSDQSRRPVEMPGQQPPAKAGGLSLALHSRW